MLDIRIVLFPRRRQVDEVLPVSLPAIPAGWAICALIIFALVPQHATDAVGESGLVHAPKQSPVDRRHVLVVFRIPLMLIDAGATDSPIDDADGNLVVLDQTTGEFHAPIT